ncbi:putative lipoprotein [Corallococcus coralloides DSM 2259]|uniref:Putative lipoprotein n=1 Tax=Corallococcus coralloides (strain ATCC 25202 / DSM 2259 / NBRC 100086 / M2) TaxID=1144275 RepID=H8MIU6_CORCM|nr:hypothetical protein [Corallococcus coralloides]AFE03731.1 putative lipoprotein [Corallococcus coralloides DSM 2259]
MNIHRLRRLFSLALPLMLAGCGGPEGSVDLTGYSEIACTNQGISVSDLTLTPEPDFVQLRSFDPDTRALSVSVSSSGQSCATATDVTACETALEDATVTSGFHYNCTRECRQHFLVTTRGDEVKTYSSQAELQQLLGTIDTEQEAVLQAFASNYSFVCGTQEQGAVKRNADGSFNVIGTNGYACGPGTKLTQYVLKVTAAGTVQKLETRILEEGDPVCPAGQ